MVKKLRINGNTYNLATT